MHDSEDIDFSAYLSDSEDDQDDSDNLENFKGIYYEVDSQTKYTCAKTGAHFKFDHICKLLLKLKQSREQPAI